MAPEWIITTLNRCVNKQLSYFLEFLVTASTTTPFTPNMAISSRL